MTMGSEDLSIRWLASHRVEASHPIIKDMLVRAGSEAGTEGGEINGAEFLLKWKSLPPEAHLRGPP